MADTRPIKAGRAFVELFADSSKLAKGLSAAEGKLKAWGKSIQAAGIKMLAAGGAVVTPILAAAKTYASAGSQLTEMSQRTGMSVEALSALKYAAGQCGVEIDGFQKGIFHMDRLMLEAARGSDQARDTLFQLGLTMSDLRNLSPEDQFTLVADRLSKVENPAKRAALAMDLFSRSGAELLPMLEGGAAGLAVYRAEAERLGFVMTGEEAKAAHALEQTLVRLGGAWNKIVNAVGSSVGPVLTEWAGLVIEKARAVADWIKKNKDLIVTILKVGVAVAAAGVVLIGVGLAFKFVAAVIGGVLAGIGVLHTILAAVVTVLGAILSPIGLVIAGFVLLGQEILRYTGAGAAAVQWLGQVFGELADDVRSTMGAIGDALASGDLATAGKLAMALLKLEWARGSKALLDIWIGVKQAFYDAWDSLCSVLVDKWEVLKNAWAEFGVTMAAIGYTVTGTVKIGWARLSTWMAQSWAGWQIAWEETCDDLFGTWQGIVAALKRTWAEFQHMIGELDSEELARTLADIEKERTTKVNVHAMHTGEAIGKLVKLGDVEEVDYAREKVRTASEILDKMKADQTALKQYRIDNLNDSRMFDQGAAVDKAKRDKEWADKLSAAQQDVDKAKEELDKAKADAAAGAKGNAKKPELKMPGVGAALEWTEAKVSTAGTFNPNALWGFAGSEVLNRIAAATEKTAKNTAKGAAAPKFSGG